MIPENIPFIVDPYNTILILLNIALTTYYILWRTELNIWTGRDTPKYTMHWDIADDDFSISSKKQIDDITNTWADHLKNTIDKEIIDEINKEKI